MIFAPAIANSNYGKDLKHEKKVMDVKELINSSLKFSHNVPIVIHPTAELSVPVLNPDLILQGKLFSADLGSAFEAILDARLC